MNRTLLLIQRSDILRSLVDRPLVAGLHRRRELRPQSRHLFLRALPLHVCREQRRVQRILLRSIQPKLLLVSRSFPFGPNSSPPRPPGPPLPGPPGPPPRGLGAFPGVPGAGAVCACPRPEKPRPAKHKENCEGAHHHDTKDAIQPVPDYNPAGQLLQRGLQPLRPLQHALEPNPPPDRTRPSALPIAGTAPAAAAGVTSRQARGVATGAPA